MADLTKEQLRQQNETLFADNNSGNISAEDLRTFNNEIIDTLATENNPSFTGSVQVDGSVTADTFFGDGSNLTGVVSEVPSGTISGSSQVDYPLISNIPSGIVSSSVQVDVLQTTNISRLATTGSNTFSGSQTIIGTTSLNGYVGLNGDLETYSSNINNYGGRIQGIAHGFENGSSPFTGSFSGDGSQLTNLPIEPLPSGVVSGSSQIILQDTTGLLSGSRIDGVVALATNSTYAQNTITTGKNLHTTTIEKGTPLFFTGSGTSGNLVGVLPADAGNPERMPAGGIAGESIAVGAEGVILLDGFINNVNTSLFPAGDKIYVGVGGGYTNVEPTGSAFIQFLGNIEKSATAGSGVIQMMGESRKLPNIPQGQAWVGDSNGVPQAVSTASWDAHSDLTQLNQFTASQEVLNATFATTGSNTFQGQQIVFGNILQPSGDITSANGRINAQNIGIIQGVSTFTGSFVGDGSSLTNLPIDLSIYATTGSNTFNGNQVIEGTNVSPAQTLLVKNGNSGIRFAVQNETLAGLTGIDVISNGNTQIGGELTVNDHSFIISSGSNTISFDPYIVSGDSAQVLFTAPNANFNSTGNFNIQVGGIAATDANRIDLNSNTINANGNLNQFDSNITQDSSGPIVSLFQNPQLLAEYYGNQLYWDENNGNSGFNAYAKNKTEILLNTWSGSYDNALYLNVLPSGTEFSDWDGSYTRTPWLTVAKQGTPIFTRGLDVNGSFNVNGNQIVNGTNTAPSSTFEAKNGNGVPRLVVQNEQLAGITGVDVILNGNGLVGGNLTFPAPGQIINIANGTVEAGEVAASALLVDSLEPNTGGEISVPSGNFSLTGTGQVLQNPNGAIVASSIEGQAEMATPLFLVDSIEPNTGTGISISGTSLSINTTQPLQANSGVNVNGALQVNNGFIFNAGAEYRGVQTYTPTANTTVTLNGQDSDFFEVILPAGGTTNINMISYDQGRAFNLKIVQNGTTPANVTFDSKFKFAGGATYTVSPGLNAVDILDIKHYDVNTLADLYVTSIAQNFS